MTGEIESKLIAIFIDSLDLEPDVDVTQLEYRKIENWDSVAHMVLVGEIEDHYQIVLDIEDIIDMSSFKKVVEIVEKSVSKS